MRNISKAFLAGLLALLPIMITVALLVWIGQSAESVFGGALKKVLPHLYIRYVPGMGLFLFVIIVFVFGLMLRAWAVRVVFEWGEKLLQRVPLVKTIYGGVRDLTGFLSESKGRTSSQVVVVTMGSTGLRQLGFLTRNDFAGLPEGLGDSNTVAVYLPMSYQMGGYTTLVPREWARPVEMSFEDAMRFALTAGMSTAPKAGEKERGGLIIPPPGS